LKGGVSISPSSERRHLVNLEQFLAFFALGDIFWWIRK
jgi:hypothetical protein